MKLIVILCLSFFAIVLGSCCDDKECPSAEKSISVAFPYQANEIVVFSDTAGNRITAKLNTSETKSEAYTTYKDCSFSMSEEDGVCIASKKLDAQSVKDESNKLDAYQLSFSQKIYTGEESWKPVYEFRGLGLAIQIKDYNTTSNLFTQYIKLDSFTTPFQSYTNVYQSIKQSRSGFQQVVTSTGRIISFNLRNDTNVYFYSVK